jgi:uncharacterized protein YbjQ (UPF0145 family)
VTAAATSAGSRNKSRFYCRLIDNVFLFSMERGCAMNHSLTTTAFEIEGYRITRNLGIVKGITVRSRSVFGTIGGALQTIVGGNISMFTQLCEKTRNDAFAALIIHAENLGANAVIGIRYDANEVMQGVTEVLCYGTAVVVEKK